MNGKRSKALRKQAFLIAESHGITSSRKENNRWVKGTPIFVYKKLKQMYKKHIPVLN